MHRLTIAEQALTPAIDLDPETGLLTFSGESYPENVMAFYRPVLEWLRAYWDSPTPPPSSGSACAT